MMKVFNSELKLIKALKAKNKTAQNEFYKEYSGRLFAICKRYLTDQTEAEDIFIEGMMKVFDKVHQFDNNGSFEGWAKKIMVNQSLMALRKKKVYFSDINDHSEELSDLPSTQLEVNDLLLYLNELPEGYRTVFNLYAIEGYNHGEIAKKLGISEGTSKSQLSRARHLLQKRIKESSYENR